MNDEKKKSLINIKYINYIIYSQYLQRLDISLFLANGIEN